MSGSVSMIDGHIDEVLKPCPFCGGRPHFEKFERTLCCDWTFAFKHTCGGGAPGNNKRISIYASGFESGAEAIEAWNRRTDT